MRGAVGQGWGREAAKILLIGSILAFAYYPMVTMLSISLKTNEQFVRNPWFFDEPANWNWENWITGWNLVGQYIGNSFFQTTTATALMVCMAIVCAYVVARYRFPGRGLFYYGLMATIFLPPSAASLVTTFNLLQNMQLMNSLWALILPVAFGGQAVTVIILRQFIEDIPRDLFESAQLDGAGHLTQIKDIVLPLSGSIIGVLTIQAFIHNWNELMLPLVMIRDEARQTIPLGLMMLDGEYHKQWGELMAAYSISALPLLIIFFFAMRLFVKGLASGAVKG